ncbi:hypothetical protein LTR56_009193 [Elasticomyces elasticus]|nr:hypothetical protein LTR56_009193 [Elasticomyces elasticus]KAK3664726.1 hypothetical protein LTR22_004313 [Elasticomyces elasticus]KAK4928536.1 hypothetical protein LTR49_004656 [Elasticomyces elasticus]KAK5765104.1 hypothetical protein LTS12_004615 [Elasticomyces elasticus]
MDASNNTRERVGMSAPTSNEDVVVSMLMNIASNSSGPREAESRIRWLADSRTWPVVLKYDCTPSFTKKICTAMCEAHRQGKLSKEVAAMMCALVVNACLLHLRSLAPAADHVLEQQITQGFSTWTIRWIFTTTSAGITS